MTHRHLDALDAEPPTMERLAVPQSRSASGYASRCPRRHSDGRRARLCPTDSPSYPPTMVTPVITAIHGPREGVGLTTALHADIRFVADDAKPTASTDEGGGLDPLHGAPRTRRHPMKLTPIL